MLLRAPASSARCPGFDLENTDVGVTAPALRGVPGAGSQVTADPRPPPLTQTRSFCTGLSVHGRRASKRSKWMVYRDSFSSFS